jgi:putative ABC transport system substrate-binding protein
MDRRRFLLTSLAGALAAPLAAEAQQAKLVRIGFLSGNPASDTEETFDAFRMKLRTLGYAEGRNLVVESRHAESRYERLPQLVAELVRRSRSSSLASLTRWRSVSSPRCPRPARMLLA